MNEPWRTALTRAYARGLRPLLVEEPMRPSEWAARHFRLSAESSALPGAFEPWPYQIALLDLMGGDEVPVITVRKSARIGYTKCLLSTIGYLHEHRRRNVLIYQPTDQQAKEFAKDSVDTMLRDVPVLQELLIGSGKRGESNTLQEKFFVGSNLHVRGGRTPDNYRRLTKSTVMYDELDAFEHDIGGEGDPVSLGDRRTLDSPYSKSIRGSTPTIKHESLMEKSEESADLTFRFGMNCESCGEWHSYEYAGPDGADSEIFWQGEVQGGLQWEAGEPETVKHYCPHCGVGETYAEFQQRLPKGEWRSDDCYISADNELRDLEEDTVIDWPRHVCFIVWAVYSMTFAWEAIARERDSIKYNPARMKAFVNTMLGDYWDEPSISVSPHDLKKRQVAKPALYPKEIKMITFGADVQSDRLEVEFVGWGKEEECWGLGYKIFPGDTTKATVWTNLRKELVKPFPLENGKNLRAAMGIVDSGYLSDMVYQFSRHVGLRFVLPGKGLSTPGRPIETYPRRPSANHRVYIIQIGTDTAKDLLYKRLQIQEPGPGYCHFYDTEDYDDEYFMQLTGEEKRLKTVQGRTVYRYEKVHKNVEALDCRVYALAAIRCAQENGNIRLFGNYRGR